MFQNTIGMLIFLSTILCVFITATLFYFAVIPAWLCIVIIAWLTSIAHELEHDLIHFQYFKHTPFIHNFMMLMVWIIRPNTVNPWYRRKIHLHHHKTSGTPQDIEERLVGNGEPNPLMRIIVILDGLLGLILRKRKFDKEINNFNFFTVFNAAFPFATAYYICIYSFIAWHFIDSISPSTIVLLKQQLASDVISSMTYWFNFIMVVLIAPNFIRSASLNLVTSSMHYYGGVNNLLQQTQILNHWLFVPFQWFCFNFGHTHSMHHFVPNQPFYIRQLIFKKVQKTMIENGVRTNNLNTVLQGNIYR